MLQSPSSYARHCALLAGSHEIARQSALPRKGYPSPGRVVTWLQHGIRGLVRYYTTPQIPSPRPQGSPGDCNTKRFRESNCVLCLMFSPTQRPTTACRSGHVVAGPRGIRMCATFTLILYCDAIQTPRGQECNIALHSRAFTAPAMPHGQGRGLANAHRGFLCACSPSCAVSALRQNCSEANHRRAPESAG